MSQTTQRICKTCPPGGHLTEEMIAALVSGKLGINEKIEALDHIAVCEACSERLTDAYENVALLKLPPQFCDEVRSSLRQYVAPELNRNLVEPQIRKSDRQERQKEYRRYSFRVVLAACFTMVLLFSSTVSTGIAALNDRMANPDFSHIEKFSQGLNNFSNQVLNWEAN